MSQVSVVIGASGGIGQAVVTQLSDQGESVYALSRAGTALSVWGDNVETQALDSNDEAAIAAFIQSLKDKGEVVRLAICTIGMLHDDNASPAISPEKKLEDLDTAQLTAYFSVNTILPALWLKHLVGVVDKEQATVVCLSARVGSISDNRLGGWYGYRASKAALNMLLKTAAIEYNRRTKTTTLVSYHPGTVDTGLSQPFQANVKPEKLFEPEFTAKQLLTHIKELDLKDSPHFIDWDGKPVSW
ncbi:SDR family NAD(P)-dependent oxidoreductase [Alteromonas halophila]|uniref:Short-chain dehydrogenase n=1 Tax=Alteromonas halophila TaxID=516698 RepID=A0A918JNT1_9ALTE|nr:SDR family NAD(P)-dependent oxidoreductase [Alteromonas halophila]GGW91881.1 short-chain dehydrogenase [Alteromonas halophila]